MKTAIIREFAKPQHPIIEDKGRKSKQNKIQHKNFIK